MFFYASKILGFFALPSNLIMVMGMIGALLLATRFHRAGWRLVVASLLLLAVLGFSPVGNTLIVALEERFPVWDEGRGPPHGVVVLGGAMSPELSGQRNAFDLNESAERLTAAVDLARRYPEARMIYSGGVATILHGSRTEAGTALMLFESLGLPKGRVIAEGKSRNTWENAVFSKEIAQPKPGERWLLVTSANHMPRSIGVFRKAGFDVEPYPVDWRSGSATDAWKPFLNLSDGLRRTDTAMREWVGLLAYWLTGKSSELFPAPRSGGCDLASAADKCRPDR